MIPPELISMSATAPERPIRTPSIWDVLKILPKKSEPTMTTKTGVSEFNIPAIALAIWVWACVKRNAGMPLPKRPTANMYR